MVPKGLFEGFGGIVRNPSQDSEGFLRIHLKIAEHVQGLALENPSESSEDSVGIIAGLWQHLCYRSQGFSTAARLGIFI